tara:strand:+ start:39129 stop:39329 length:201 start_codon:yes stop_codon:yes gene_type:complete
MFYFFYVSNFTLSLNPDSKATTSTREGTLISKAIKSPLGGGVLPTFFLLFQAGIVFTFLLTKGILK